MNTPLHHHPNDGAFRQNCARCQIERAAPDLLAACRVARLQLNDIRQAVFDNQPVSNGWFEAAFASLDAAIERATGQPIPNEHRPAFDAGPHAHELKKSKPATANSAR